AWESNPPATSQPRPPYGFEDRGRHQPPSASSAIVCSAPARLVLSTPEEEQVMVQWRGRQGSDNVEDRRGMSVGRGAVIGGGGIGTLVIILAVSLLTHRNPLDVLSQVQPAPQANADNRPAGAPPANDEQAQFVSVILKDTEDVWGQLLPKLGAQYSDPHLVLFSDAVQSACGMADAAVGPFYCSRDQKVYLDMSFFRDLSQRFGAPGEFARAYVIAHEVGHHVQNLLGISAKVQQYEQAARS